MEQQRACPARTAPHANVGVEMPPIVQVSAMNIEAEGSEKGENSEELHSKARNIMSDVSKHSLFLHRNRLWHGSI